MRAKRNFEIEEELQSILNGGGNVWAIGDVHGHADTLKALVGKLNLGPLDRVVLLGDLVDRGPKSCEVLRFARENSRIFAVKGNHEEMMLDCFEPDHIEEIGLLQSGWYYVGGRATAQSYIDEFTNEDESINHLALRKRAGRDLSWIDSLPEHLVLDEFRLVHAGYSPYAGVLDEQSSNNLLWIRSEFHNSSTPVDEFRTIVFGHSPLPGFGIPQTGIWFSESELENGRHAALGIDSCCFGGSDPQLTAFNLQNGEIVKQRVILNQVNDSALSIRNHEHCAGEEE